MKKSKYNYKQEVQYKSNKAFVFRLPWIVSVLTVSGFFSRRFIREGKANEKSYERKLSILKEPRGLF